MSPQEKYEPEPDTVGFTLGSVKNKTLLKSHGQSSLYQLNIDEMLDNQPYKLIELLGTHY